MAVSTAQAVYASEATTQTQAVTSGTVLLIEDEGSIAQLLSTLMASHKVRVIHAQTGQQAMALLAKERPLLITLDLVLPDIDGFTLLSHIRQQPQLDDVPVLMISAQAEPSAQRRAYQGGVSDFIAKPFHVDLLDAKLRAWIQLAQRAQRPPPPPASRTNPLRDFAHEVRNPITAISAAAHRLSLLDVGSEQRQRLSRAIAAEADRLGRMVSHYLDGGTQALIGDEPYTGEPLTLLRELLELNVPEAARQRIQLLVTESLPALRVDPDHLRQMLLNLLENALAATTKQGSVSISVSITSSAVSISISDTGCGIPSEDLPRIFEDGFTTRSDKTRGLGLGITKRLCEKAGGTLTVHSAVNQGTQFSLSVIRAC